MLDISLDKRLELLSGLQYYVAKKNNLNYHWIKENYKEYNSLFYELCDKYISKELEEYILQGSLGYYEQPLILAFHLDEDYNIINRETLKLNKNIDLDKLERLIKEFVTTSNYDSFFNNQKELFISLKEKMTQFINYYEPFNKEKIINFFGYQKGDMKMINLNFIRGNYGLEYNNDTYFISDIKRINNEFNVSSGIIRTLYHEFSHPYVNPLGEKYFKDIDLSPLINDAKENGLESWYNTPITLINEYVVRACETMLISNLKDINESFMIHQKVGYKYIKELCNLFNNKNNYPTFEEFYKNEIVPFFLNLNNKLSKNDKIKRNL